MKMEDLIILIFLPVILIININNDRGIMNRLVINNPYVINKVNISVIGILTNSSINVQNTNNFNMTCSNVIDNGKEIIAGECKNVTMRDVKI